MRLFKRSNGIYYIKIFDESGNEIKRVSTKKKKKNEAIKFLSEYEKQNKENRSTFSSYRDIMLLASVICLILVHLILLIYLPSKHTIRMKTLRRSLQITGKNYHAILENA